MFYKQHLKSVTSFLLRWSTVQPTSLLPLLRSSFGVQPASYAHHLTKWDRRDGGVCVWPTQAEGKKKKKNKKKNKNKNKQTNKQTNKQANKHSVSLDLGCGISKKRWTRRLLEVLFSYTFSFSFSFFVQLLSSLGVMALVSLLGSFGFRFRGSKTKKKVVDQSLSLFWLLGGFPIWVFGFSVLSWFLVSRCLWVPGLLMAIDECVCGGGW
jgi:hypothetical protein